MEPTPMTHARIFAAALADDRPKADAAALFVVTEKGFTYRLSLTAAEDGSAQRLIRNPAALATAEDSGPDARVGTLVALVRAAARREPPTDAKPSDARLYGDVGQDRGRSRPRQARMRFGARTGTDSPAIANRSSSPVTTASACPAQGDLQKRQIGRIPVRRHIRRLRHDDGFAPRQVIGQQILSLILRQSELGVAIHPD